MAPSLSCSLRKGLIPVMTIISHVVTLVSATCYFPNGTDRNTNFDAHGNDYHPSGSGSSLDNFSMCCATNGRAVPDTPRKDGLCENSDNEGDDRYTVDNRVTLCPDGSFCCDDKNTTCCMQGNGFWIRDGQPTKINPNATQNADSATESSATPAVPPPALAPAPAPLKSNGLSEGAMAGIAIGAVVGVATLGFALWFWVRRKRRRGSEEETGKTISKPENLRALEREGDSAYLETGVKEGTSRYLHIWEIDGGRRVELDGRDQPDRRTTEPQELVGSTTYQELE
ncbi:MAG: hypothetical protein Q9223_001273 [Gallowayella weberi]